MSVDVKEIAGSVTAGMRRALFAMSAEWQFPGNATFNATGAHCLVYMRKPPLAELSQQRTSERANARWRIAFRLTPLGLAVKAHLLATEPTA